MTLPYNCIIIVPNIVIGAAIGAAFELAAQLKSGDQLNWAKIGVATLSGGISAGLGPVGGALVSGATNVVMDMLDGERDAGKLVVSGFVGVASSLIGTGAGKVVEKIANKPGIRALGNMSKGKRKQIVMSLKPTTRGSERNRMKTMSYLVANDPNIGSKYFASTETGKLITTAAEGTAGGFANAGLTWAKERLLP